MRAFLEEHPDFEVVVVVDATFEHRIAPAERAPFKQAELAGELVTPPAGVVGRGDAFILKIAQRADAIVLSNDSFQEFHAEHPWLFEEGRLVGGKPVATRRMDLHARNPVRGLKSKAATTKAARAAKAASAPRQRRHRRSAPDIRPWRRAEGPGSGREAAKPDRRRRGAEEAGKRAAKATAEPRATSPRATARTEVAATAKKRVRKQVTAPTPPEARKRAGKTASAQAVAKAPAKAPDVKGRPEPVNTARSFQRLTADHPLGSVVEGEVVQFTSHGALVSIPVGRTMHVICYAPLAGLGSPAPTRARDVLRKGESYQFAVVSFDATRRRAELTLEGTR